MSDIGIEAQRRRRESCMQASAVEHSQCIAVQRSAWHRRNPAEFPWFGTLATECMNGVSRCNVNTVG